MTHAFLSGSRSVSRLPAEVEDRIETLISSDTAVLVGDANGADKAFQRYLAKRSYRSVTVFCSGETCRNNIGNWETRNIEPSSRRRDANFYAEKDRAMAEAASFGIMLWDSASAGTLLNAYRLVVLDKEAVIFDGARKQFQALHNMRDWRELLARADADLKSKIAERLEGEPLPSDTNHQLSLFG